VPRPTPTYAPLRAETAPPDFDDLEHSKSFTVHDVNGVNVMLMTALTGKPERDRASVGVQVMMDRGYHTMYIYSDDRDPTITAVYQPGQEGHILRLSGAHRISPAAAVELESTVCVTMHFDAAYHHVPHRHPPPPTPTRPRSSIPSW